MIGAIVVHLSVSICQAQQRCRQRPQWAVLLGEEPVLGVLSSLVEGPRVSHSVTFCCFSEGETALIQNPLFQEGAGSLLSCPLAQLSVALNGLRRGHMSAHAEQLPYSLEGTRFWAADLA